jgi:hypothetical protein
MDDAEDVSEEEETEAIEVVGADAASERLPL